MTHWAATLEIRPVRSKEWDLWRAFNPSRCDITEAKPITRLQQLKPIPSGIDDSDDIDHFGFLIDGVKNHITFHDELPIPH